MADNTKAPNGRSGLFANVEASRPWPEAAGPASIPNDEDRSSNPNQAPPSPPHPPPHLPPFPAANHLDQRRPDLRIDTSQVPRFPVFEASSSPESEEEEAATAAIEATPSTASSPGPRLRRADRVPRTVQRPWNSKSRSSSIPVVIEIEPSPSPPHRRPYESSSEQQRQELTPLDVICPACGHAFWTGAGAGANRAAWLVRCVARSCGHEFAPRGARRRVPTGFDMGRQGAIRIPSRSVARRRWRRTSTLNCVRGSEVEYETRVEGDERYRAKTSDGSSEDGDAKFGAERRRRRRSKTSDLVTVFDGQSDRWIATGRDMRHQERKDGFGNEWFREPAAAIRDGGQAGPAGVGSGLTGRGFVAALKRRFSRKEAGSK